MSALVEVDLRACRVRILGWHLHHGLVGAALAAIGAVLMAHDRSDAPWLR